MSAGVPARRTGVMAARCLVKSSQRLPRRSASWGGHLGDHEAGGDRVRGDAERAQLDRERAGGALQPGLGRRVVDLAAGAQRGHAGQADDPPPAGRHHVPLRRLAGQEEPAQVHRHDGVPVVLGHLEQQVVPGDPGVVDQHAERAELLGDPVDGGGDLPASATFAAEPERPAPGRSAISFAVWRGGASSRSSSATSAPSAASRSAVAAPMPRAPPVTRATRFSSRLTFLRPPG